MQYIARALPGTTAEKFEGDGWAAGEEGDTFARDEGEVGEVEFVDKFVGEKVVPEDAA